MATADADQVFDAFRYDLVGYLAQRLDMPQEIALQTLGDWLVDFRPKHVALEPAASAVPPDDDELAHAD